MSTVEEFEILLKDVVHAKRLSASKMTRLTEISTKCMHQDTQLVSVLYRTHKALPSSSKVSSLYVFDAVARSAKHQVTKQKEHAASFLSKLGSVVEGLYRDMQDPAIPEGKEKSKKVLDIWISKGTFPTDILSRLGDILKGNDKAPEKRTSLSVDHAKPAETTIIPPPMSPTHSQSLEMPAAIAPGIPTQDVPAPAPAPTQDPQAALLALLAQAANAGPVVQPYPQPPVNTAEAQFAAAQFMLQQLAQTTGIPHAQNVAPPSIVSAPNDFTGHPNSSSRSPIADDTRDPRRALQSHREASRQEHYVSPPESGRPPYDSHSDRRPYARAPPARGNPRGHGFSGPGDRDRRRRDDGHGDRRDRDYAPYRDRDNQQRDRSPPPAHRRGGGRGGRSRSRSPPPPSRYRERRRTPSPRRPPSWQQSSSRRSETTLEAPSGKDEFGRDVRPASPPTENGNEHPINGTLASLPKNGASTPASNTPSPAFQAFSAQTHSPRTPSRLPPTDITTRDPSNTSHRPDPNTHAAPATHNVPSPNILAAGSSMSVTKNNGPASSLPGQSAAVPPVDTNGNGLAGLEEFDFTSFDFASPASWEALGKMWEVTYGSMPAGEQLMTFVVSGGLIKPEVGKGQGQVAQRSQQQAPATQQLQSWAGSDQQDQPYADYGGGGRARGRGGAARGGFRGGYGGRGKYQGYGNGHGEMGYQGNWDYDDQGTDAIVLGGGDDSQTTQFGMSGIEGPGNSDGGGGGMQRVGDKWVFVKPTAS